VGMSTVPEAIVARHMGMKVAGISMLANIAAGISQTPIKHEEVLELATIMNADLGMLLQRFFEVFEPSE
jgi:purine-nucleoside phosphorylase